MQANDIPDIGSRRELFVDRLLVDRLEGARLKLQEPRSGGVAVQYDTAVEGYPDHPSSFYTTVFEDGGVYRMYYRGGSDSERSLTCYAESADGIVWRKPDLGIFEVDGSANHNVIGFVQAPQFCAFKDTRPDVPDSERYKANALRTTRADNVGLFAYVSADGVHWSKLREELIVPNVMRNHFDSQNVMFWSEVEQQYVLYARHMVGGKRATARATSENFLDWSEPTLMTYSDTGSTTPSEHLYTNQTNPYFRAPHIYVAMPGRILFGRRTLPPEERRRSKEAVDPEAGVPEDCSDGVLLTTRAGTATYDFTFRESFVRPGIGRSNWTTRNNYPGPGRRSDWAGRDVLLRPAPLRSDRLPSRADDAAARRLRVPQRSLRRRRDDHEAVHLRGRRAGDQLLDQRGRQREGGAAGRGRTGRRRTRSGRVSRADRRRDRAGRLVGIRERRRRPGRQAGPAAVRHAGLGRLLVPVQAAGRLTWDASRPRLTVVARTMAPSTARGRIRRPVSDT